MNGWPPRPKLNFQIVLEINRSDISEPFVGCEMKTTLLHRSAQQGKLVDDALVSSFIVDSSGGL